MNCRQITNLMSAYLDGELTGVEMLEIRRHVRICTDCREELESIRAVKFMVSRLRTVEPAEGFRSALAAKLDEIQVPVYQRAWNSVVRTLHVRPAPLKAVFVAVAAALVVMSAKSIDYVDNSGTLASGPSAIAVSNVDTYNPDILPVEMNVSTDVDWDAHSTNFLYSTPLPMSIGNNSFVTVSFAP